MTDLNNVSLTGRLTREAELKYTNGGLAICSFSLAVNRRVKKGDNWEEEASFFDVTLFGRSGEAVQRYLTKVSRLPSPGSSSRTDGRRTARSAARCRL